MESDKVNSILIKSRRDRLGSNFIFNLGIFLFSKINKLKLKGEVGHEYRDSIFFINFFDNIKFRSKEKYRNDKKIVFIRYCDPNFFFENGGFDNNLKYILSGMKGPILNSLYYIKEDIVSYFNKNFKNNFIDIIKNKLKKYKLPWDNNKDIICIHIRLDDQSNESIKTYNMQNDYIKKLIDTDKLNDYNYKQKKYTKEEQSPIHYLLLEELIIELKNKYPNKQIYIIKRRKFSKKFVKFYNEIIKKYNIKTSTSVNIEEDIWKLMNSEILVLSKSTFPYVAGFYHLGSQIYYEKWSISACLGLGTKYDKSNWIGFPNKEMLKKVGIMINNKKNN